MTSLRLPARTKRGKSLFITDDPAAAAVARTDRSLLVVEAALPEEVRNFLEKNYCPRSRVKKQAEPQEPKEPPNAPKQLRRKKEAKPLLKGAGES